MQLPGTVIRSVAATAAVFSIVCQSIRFIAGSPCTRVSCYFFDKNDCRRTCNLNSMTFMVLQTCMHVHTMHSSYAITCIEPACTERISYSAGEMYAFQERNLYT